MSALSSDVAGDVDMSTDQHDDSAMNVDEARLADQEGTTEVDQPTAKRAKVGEEGTEQDKGMGDEAGEVREFPTDVPMENEYPGTYYYVRECYSTYYDLVMHLFNEEEMAGVTVTGTPGTV
jgi:pyrrolidone-carboxylate peptidase